MAGGRRYRRRAKIDGQRPIATEEAGIDGQRPTLQKRRRSSAGDRRYRRETGIDGRRPPLQKRRRSTAGGG
jgi:hypothetical protein